MEEDKEGKSVSSQVIKCLGSHGKNVCPIVLEGTRSPRRLHGSDATHLAEAEAGFLLLLLFQYRPEKGRGKGAFGTLRSGLYYLKEHSQSHINKKTISVQDLCQLKWFTEKKSLLIVTCYIGYQGIRKQVRQKGRGRARRDLCAKPTQ